LAGTKLALAVAASDKWDEREPYDVPEGYRWATTAEVIAEAPKCTESEPAYMNQCGWKGFTFPPGESHVRIGFVCKDSLKTKKVHKACANIRLYPMVGELAHARNGHFAGVMCIEDDIVVEASHLLYVKVFRLFCCCCFLYQYCCDVYRR
jgi:hypothetical protein